MSEVPAVHSPLRWFPEMFALHRKRLWPQARLLGLALVVGVVAGLGAVAFYSACELASRFALDGIAGYDQGRPGGEPAMFAPSGVPLQPWLLVVIPAIGGLLCGLLVYSLAPEAEGHGTDAAIDAYHQRQGVIRPRVPLIKILASALTLGTGGSGGREGPIAQVGAGCGSWLGGLLRLRPAERRVLLAAGMGAGVGAIFRAPLAGALFAAEVLYSSPELEADVLLPSALACITAYCTFSSIFGWQPLFLIPPDIARALVFNNPLSLFPYLILAVAMAIFAMLYVRTFYGLTGLFRRLPILPHFRPAIGAALTGLIGVGLYYSLGGDSRVLAVLSFGYGIVQDGINIVPGQQGNLYLALLLALAAVGKLLTTSLTIGSGGSAGVFGPSMVVGGCGGGALGILLAEWLPGITPPPAAFVIVGMAGFFAAAAKTPLSTLVINTVRHGRCWAASRL